MPEISSNSPFLTLPHPEKENRNLKFRVRDYPERGLTLLEHADDSGAWAPTRMATEEEIALWSILHATGNACVTEGAGRPMTWTREKPPQRIRALVRYRESHTKQEFTTVAEFIPYKTVLSEDFLSEECDPGDCDWYDEEKDCYWVNEGWWESSYVADTNWALTGEVVAWMLLPKAPETSASESGERSEPAPTSSPNLAIREAKADPAQATCGCIMVENLGWVTAACALHSGMPGPERAKLEAPAQGKEGAA